MFSLLLWIILGCGIGWGVSALGWGSGVGPVWDVLMGCCGALVGGIIASLVEQSSIAALHASPAIIAAISAFLFILLLRLLGITQRMPDMG